jgi:hypothetical protein
MKYESDKLTHRLTTITVFLKIADLIVKFYGILPHFDLLHEGK